MGKGISSLLSPLPVYVHVHMYVYTHIHMYSFPVSSPFQQCFLLGQVNIQYSYHYDNENIFHRSSKLYTTHTFPFLHILISLKLIVVCFLCCFQCIHHHSSSNSPKLISSRQLNISRSLTAPYLWQHSACSGTLVTSTLWVSLFNTLQEIHPLLCVRARSNIIPFLR